MESDIFEMFAHGLGVAQIMVLFDKAVEHFFTGGFTNLKPVKRIYRTACIPKAFRPLRFSPAFSGWPMDCSGVHFRGGSSMNPRDSSRSSRLLQTMSFRNRRGLPKTGSKKKLENARELDRNEIAEVVEKVLVEIDGCEIRTALLEEIEGTEEKTPVLRATP